MFIYDLKQNITSNNTYTNRVEKYQFITRYVKI